MTDAARTPEELRAQYAREMERLGVLQREFFAAEKAHRDQCELIRLLRVAIDALPLQ